MEIPKEFILSMRDVLVNRRPDTGKADLYTPIIASKYGKFYVPEGFLTSGEEEYFIRELRSVENFRMLIGPTVDRVHFRTTGELRGIEFSPDGNHVHFWYERHIPYEINVEGVQR